MWRTHLLTSLTGVPMANRPNDWDIDSLICGDFHLGERGEAYLDGLTNTGMSSKGGIVVYGSDVLRFLRRGFKRITFWQWPGQNIIGVLRHYAPETRISVVCMYEAITQETTWPPGNIDVEALREVSLRYLLRTVPNSYGSDCVDVYEREQPAPPQKPHSWQVNIGRAGYEEEYTAALAAAITLRYPLFSPHDVFLDNCHGSAYIPPTITNRPQAGSEYFADYKAGYDRGINRIQGRVLPVIGNNPGDAYPQLQCRMIEHSTRGVSPETLGLRVKTHLQHGGHVLLGAERRDYWRTSDWLAAQEGCRVLGVPDEAVYLMTGRSGTSFCLAYPEGVVEPFHV